MKDRDPWARPSDRFAQLVRRRAITIPPLRADANSLNVALYEWVPQPDWFKAAIESAWAAIHPDIALNWCDYNCYRDDPPTTLEVFAFDTIFADYFIAQQYLQARPVMDLDDYYAWSLQGLAVNSEWLWAVPYLGCMNVLLYRGTDSRLAPGNFTIGQLASVIGQSPNQAAEPPPGQYLLVDLTGATTDACIYLQTVIENRNPNPPLPPWNDLDPIALTDVRLLVWMAGLQQASYVDTTPDGSQRLSWFLGGAGEALVGLTETMGFMTNDQVDAMAFHPLPVANEPVGTLPLFTDAWGINRAIDPDKAGLASDFVDVATRADVTFQALMPPSQELTPQYLTPVRISVTQKLASIYPKYTQIEELISGPANGFRIGLTSRQWLAENGDGIRNEILGTEFEFEEVILPRAHRSTPAGVWRRE